jgi:hypothetical protein
MSNGKPILGSGGDSLTTTPGVSLNRERLLKMMVSVVVQWDKLARTQRRVREGSTGNEPLVDPMDELLT